MLCVKGNILVARADLGDAAFEKSVILVIGCTKTHVLGVNIAGAELSPRIYSGGPLEDRAVVLLPASSNKLWQVVRPFVLGLVQWLYWLVRSKKFVGQAIADTGYIFYPIVYDRAGQLQPVNIIKQPQSLVLVGCAGWTNEQLAVEAAAGFWTKTKVSLADLLRVPQQERWQMAQAGISAD